jgi:hypothetical protein
LGGRLGGSEGSLVHHVGHERAVVFAVVVRNFGLTLVGRQVLDLCVFVVVFVVDLLQTF